MIKRAASSVCLLVLCLILIPHPLYQAQQTRGNIYYVALNGDDSNLGSIDKPWRTFDHAIYRMAAGDTLYVRGGTYNLSKGIYIPIIATEAQPVLFAPYPGETVVLNGGTLPEVTAPVVVAGQYITVRGFEVRNSPDTGITVWGGSHITIQGNRIHGSQRGAIFAGHDTVGKVKDISIDNNIVYNNGLVNNPPPSGDGGGWPAIILSMRASNVRYTNNRVYQNYGEGLDFLMTDGGLAEGNVAYDNYSVNLYLDNARNIVVRNNLIYTTRDTRFYRYNHPAAGIQIANETYSLYIPSENNQIINNIVIGGRYGFYYGSYQSGGGLKNSLIANNTFYKAGTSMVHIDSDPGHSSTVFSNNIFYQTTDAPMVEANSGGIIFQNNLYHGGNAGDGAGAGDVLADPLLANPGTNNASDYQLRSNSPAINKGVSFASITTDYDGNPRTGAPDLGAYEYGTNSTPEITVTPGAGIELIDNGGFEAKTTAQKPDLTPWTVKNAVGDKVKCEKPGKDFAFEGECAFRFKGGTGEITTLSQNLSGVFALNDTLTFYLRLNVATPTAAGTIKLQVKYADGTVKSQSKLNIIPTSGGYTPMLGTVRITSTAVDKVQLKMTNKSASGKIYLDAVSVIQNEVLSDRQGIVPLP